MSASHSMALWAIDLLQRHAPEPLFERGPAFDPHIDVLRHYTGDPAVDSFKRQLARDEAWREAHSEDEPAEREYESDEQFFFAEQCPAESNFR